MNPFNDDDKCFQYSVTVALNYKEIGKNWQRISNKESHWLQVSMSKLLEDLSGNIKMLNGIFG